MFIHCCAFLSYLLLDFQQSTESVYMYFYISDRTGSGVLLKHDCSINIIKLLATFVFKPLASVDFTLILETCPHFLYIRKPDKRLMFGWCKDEATCSMHGQHPRFLELVWLCSTAFTLIWIVQKQIVLINKCNTASYLSLIN